MQYSAAPIIEIPSWPFVYGGPESSGKIKTITDDFVVNEQLPFQADGNGEHVFLLIEKCGENTDYVARLLARFADVRQRDIGYAGLKDRHAKTRQWFSIWLPGKADPDWKKVETDNIKVLKATRHSKKLKRGVLKANDFKLTIRNYQGNQQKLADQIEKIKSHGIANYFGSQRFGHHGQNVTKALSMFQGHKVRKEQRGIYYSAVRSYLFNQILSERIKAQTWNKAISGDCCIFDQSNSYFKIEALDDSIRRRINKAEIHPAALMAGFGEIETVADALQIERYVMDSNKALVEGLVNNNVNSDRRAMRVMVNNLKWQFLDESILQIQFSLPAGSYATSVLRELISIDN